MLSRKLSLVLLAFSLFAAESARAEITVTEEETAHFAGVVGSLQAQLAERATNLNTPEGVKEYRDLANVLRLLADVLGFDRADWNSQSKFGEFLYRTNWWITRNLRLANTHTNDGENLFPAMFEVLDTHTDAEIAGNGQLRAPLVKASKAIEQTSFLEGVAPIEQPPTARLSDKELDLAVLLSAMGVATYPTEIEESFTQEVGDQTNALKFFTHFLTHPTALKRLRALSTKSAIAGVALGIMDNSNFKGWVDSLATFGNAGVDTRGSMQRVARRDLDSVIDLVRRVKADYEAQSAPVSPRRASEPSRDLSWDVPFLVEPGRVAVPAPRSGSHSEPPVARPAAPRKFDPQSSVDLATLSSKLMYEMAIQTANFANMLDEDQEIAQLREFQTIRTIAENLDWVTAGWKAGEQKGKPFVQLLYDVNPWVMRNLMALRRGEGEEEGTSQLERLKKALKGRNGGGRSYDVGEIREASIAVQDRQFEESISRAPQEVNLDKSDITGAVTIALAYLRVAPELLIHDQHWRVGDARPNIPEIMDNVRKCLEVVARYQQLVLQIVEQFQDRPSISNLNWNVWYDTKFPIAKLAERGDELVKQLDLIQMQVDPGRRHSNWAPQIIRICLGAGVRKGEQDDCSHWDLLDSHFGIRPQRRLADIPRH